MKIKFNCVELKHKAAEKIFEHTSTLTLEEELKFWGNKSIELKQKKENFLNQKK